MSINTEKPIVFAKFLEEAMLGENGRLVFAILNAFSIGGYRLSLFEDMNFGELGRPGQMIYSIHGLDLVETIPKNTKNTIYLYDKEDKALRRQAWRKKIQIKFDLFSSYIGSVYMKREPIIMPYPMHPSNYSADMDARLNKLRNCKKLFRILFSGDTRGYVTNRTFYPKPKLTRTEIIQTVSEAIDDKIILIREDSSLNTILTGEFVRKFILVDTSRVWVNNWLDNLAKSDFFLCPPGISMPMSHNAVESMGVGVIPIINYPEWFVPALNHMENCFVFNEKEDLLDVINQVLNMEQKEIDRIRHNVVLYYETHLKPQTFIQQIEAKKNAKIVVLMRTSQCSVNNSTKLNSRSILIRHAFSSSNSY